MTLIKEKNNTHKQRKLPNDERPVKGSNWHETHFQQISTDARKWHSFVIRRLMRHSSHECRIDHRMRNELHFLAFDFHALKRHSSCVGQPIGDMWHSCDQALMDDGRISNDILYGELTSGKRTSGRPKLRYKDVCKKDVKTLGINTESWEDGAANRVKWKSIINKYLIAGEAKLRVHTVDKRRHRKQFVSGKQSKSAKTTPTIYECNLCGRGDCHSRIGLYSHRQRCGSKSNSGWSFHSQH